MADVSKFVFQPDNITVKVRDNTARTNINNEVSARQQADNNLQTAINSEATARQNADSALQTAINNISSQLSSLNNVIKPEDYGAVGDGTTDDTTAIQNCLNAAHSERKIVLFTQTYKVTTRITIYGGTHIIGYGAKIKYTHNPSSSSPLNYFLFDMSNQSNICVEGLSFEGSGYETTQYKLSYTIGGSGCNNIEIKHCNFDKHGGLSCIYFIASNNIRVDFCQITDYTYGGVMFVEVCNNVYVGHCIILDGHHIGSSSNRNRYAISLNGYYTDPPSSGQRSVGDNLIAEENFIKDSTGFWEGIDAHGGTKIKVQI